MIVTNRTRTKNIKIAISTLENILEVIEKYKGCFFWKNTGSASYRRSKEFKEEHNIEIFGDKVEVLLELDISCKNYYFTKDIYINSKKSNTTKLRGYIKKMEKILERRVSKA